jgi:hypothetical protein
MARKKIEGGPTEQLEIPGTEQEKIPALERAADKYTELRTTWQAMSKDLQTLKAKVMELMAANMDKLQHDDDTAVYVRGDYEITLTKKESVKVKIAGEEGAADEEAA